MTGQVSQPAGDEEAGPIALAVVGLMIVAALMAAW
jgi:hypothetical protein